MLTLKRPLVILDLEATGTDPQEARIIQVAAKRLKELPYEDDHTIYTASAFTEVVNPGIPVDERIRDLTSISQDELDAGSPWPKVADRLGAVIEDADLAGYNINRYDLPLLEAEYGRLNRDLPGPEGRAVVDAYALEKQLRPRTLEAVYRRRTGKDLEDAHDAAADVDATIGVLISQVEEVAGRPDEHGDPQGPSTPEDLADYARGDYLDAGRKLRERDDGAVEVCFGKHSGTTLSELEESDPGYFDWMYSEISELQDHIDEACPDHRQNHF